jgi:hypothetical protein
MAEILVKAGSRKYMEDFRIVGLAKLCFFDVLVKR